MLCDRFAHFPLLCFRYLKITRCLLTLPELSTADSDRLLTHYSGILKKKNTAGNSSLALFRYNQSLNLDWLFAWFSARPSDARLEPALTACKQEVRLRWTTSITGRQPTVIFLRHNLGKKLRKDKKWNQFRSPNCTAFFFPCRAPQPKWIHWKAGLDRHQVGFDYIKSDNEA